MKKILFCLEQFLCFSLAVLFASCSHGVSGSEFDLHTLRMESDEMASSVKWEGEIESSILSNKISGADGLVKSLSASPQYIFASGAEDSYAAVYPMIRGFASLDMSGCPEGARKVLDEFCSSVAAGKNAENCMARDSLYSLVLFMHDLGELGYSAFDSYILGEPFVSPELVQCPVRFAGKDSLVLDVLLYMTEDGSGIYRIRNIVLKEAPDAGRD